MDAQALSPAETVLASVQADPRAAADAAQRLLEASDDPRERAIARWAVGFAARELADLESADASMRRAVDEAAALGDTVLAARITTSLALVVMNRASPGEALAMIEPAIAALDGGDRARAVMQRGAIRYRLADFDGALADHLAAADDLRRAGDWVALARLHVNIGSIQSFRRDFDAADDSLGQAIELAEAHGQDLLAGYAHHNRAHLQALRGDVPAALTSFEVAMGRYQELGAPPDQVATLMADRARTLAGAGLRNEARESVDAAYTLVRAGANVAEAADIALLTAQIRLDDGDPGAAIEPATWASAAYVAQQRGGWVPLCDLAVFRAEIDLDSADVDPVGRAGVVPHTHERARIAVDLARRLETWGWIDEAQSALILAGEQLAAIGRIDEARTVLDDAARLDGVTLKSRVARWLAAARRHLLGDDLLAVRAAVDAGLDVLASNRALLGAVELRSRSIEAGAELTAIGVEAELRRGQPTEVIDVLRRAMLAERSAVRTADETLELWLAELRQIVLDVRTAEHGDERVDLRQRQADLERRIRDRARQLPAAVDDERGSRRRGPSTATARPAPAETVETVDRLVTLSVSDDEVVAIVACGTTTLIHRARAEASVARLLESADFAMHRLHRSGISQASSAAASATLDDVGAALDGVLVPDALRHSSRPLVLTPSGALHGLTWPALPSLRGRPITVSATLGSPPEPHRHRRVLLVAGPDLAHADAEIHGIAGPAPTAAILDSSSSSIERVVRAIGEADLVHIACHGTFRVDNPLFSSLRLTDGDLTVFELERCERLPHTIVLSACNAGQSAVLRGGALLGMADALLQMGVSSVIAPLTPVNDERLVPVMTGLHAALAAGQDAASALASVTTDGSGRLDPTAAAFVCFGR